MRAPLRPRITKSDLSRWGYSDGCLRCRQIRSGRAEDGSKHSEQCRKRIEAEMRREDDPIIKRAEDKHTYFQEDVMKAQKTIEKRAAKAARTRRGGDGEDIAPENQNEDVPGPSAGRAETYDHWRIDGDEVIRVHINPRRALFTPSNTKCPIPDWGANQISH